VSQIIRVGMADLAVCKAPDGVTTLGLGSCVGIAIRDPVTKVGGLAHVMLPDSTAIKNNGSIEKFADTGIEELVRQMVAAGANRSRLEAKIAGGAQMFSFQKNCDLISVGDRNAEASKAKLKQMGIKLLAEDCGKNYGRTVIFYPETGQYIIRAVGKPETSI
jgi:chemotaxis protein CheD